MHQIIQCPHSCWWSFSILWTNIVFVGILHAVQIFWLVLSTHLLHLKILMPMYRRQVEKPTCQPVAHWKSHDHSEHSSSREWYPHLHGPRVKEGHLGPAPVAIRVTLSSGSSQPSSRISEGAACGSPVNVGILVLSSRLQLTSLKQLHHWQYKVWASPTVPQFVTRQQIYRPPFPFA